MTENLKPSQEEPEQQIDRRIVENLRRAFNRTMDEAIPQRFHDLLAQLREQEAATAAGGQENTNG